jgi:hypothetical protein
MAYNTGTDPTLAELITGKFIPEKYSKDVIMHTKSALVVADSCNHDYQSDLQYGSVVNISAFSEGSDSEVTPGTEPTPVDSVGTPASLTVNKWRQITHEISKMSKIQSYADYFAQCAKSQAYTLAKRVDTDLGALFSTLSSSSVYGSDGQEMTDDILLAIIQGLDEADVPAEDRVIIGDPSTWVDLLKIDKFVKSDYGAGKVVATGQMGQIYGMPFKKTNNLTTATTGNYGVVMHRDAIGLVMQSNPDSNIIPQPWKFRTLIITDVIYGVGEIRDTFGKAFYSHKA